MEAEAEVGQEVDRVLRAAMMGAMQVREALQRREQQSQQLRQQEEQTRQAREQRVAQAVTKDIHRSSFWQEASNERLANTYSVVSYLSAQGHPDAQSAHSAMTDRLRTRFGINIDDLNRDHPEAPKDLHRALVSALDDARQHEADQSERDEVHAGAQAEAREAEHLADAGEAAAEVEQDESHADLTRSQSADTAPAEVAVVSAHSDVTEAAPKPMKDAAVSYRAVPDKQLASTAAKTGVKAKTNRELVPAQRGAERGR